MLKFIIIVFSFIFILSFLMLALKGCFALISVGFESTSPALGVPMWIPYLSVPIGIIYITLELVIVTISKYKERNS